MTTLMRKAQDYFARREGLWYRRQVMKYLHRRSRRGMKKFKPVMVVRTYPNGVQEKTLMRLYKRKFHLPVEWINEEKTKKDKVLTLVDGTTIQLTKPKKSKGSIHGLSFAMTMEDEL